MSLLKGTVRQRARCTSVAVRCGALLATGILVASCRDTAVRSVSDLPGYCFDYVLENREPTDLIQAFDDGHNTYLQFTDLERDAPTICDEQGAVAFERSASFAIITGRHPQLMVLAQGAQSVVKINSCIAAESLTKSSATPGVDINAEEAEVMSLREHIAELEAQLAVSNAELASLQPKLIVHFANNSARVDLGEDTLHAIAAMMRERDEILVVGYTDAHYPNEAGETLARRRAENVSRALIRQGIPLETLKVAHHAAGEFVAENESAQGKALNRRVEINTMGQGTKPAS